MRKTLNVVLKILPFGVVGIFLFLALSSGKEPSVEAVLDYLPDNLFFSALLLLLMYALKSLSVVFPLIVLQIAAGMIFPPVTAIILNTIGTGIAYTVPYIIGRFSGSDAAERIMKKYPKAKDIIMVQRTNTWFPSFLLRAVSCLPGDIISMCLGSIRVPYIPYVVASILGTFPGLIPATIAGVSIMDPTSLVFIISVAVTVLSSVGSVIIYLFLNKHKKNS